MAPVSAKSKSSGSSITIFIVDFQNIITNTIRMVGNASYSYSLSTSSGKSPSPWLMDSTCFNHMRPHSSLFSQHEPTPHPVNIRTANGCTMFSNNIGSISTSNPSILEVFNVPNLSYSLFSLRQLAELIILGVLCKVQRRDRNLELVQKLGVCFSRTTFIVHLLLLFLLLLQLLQFLFFLPFLFGMPELVMHLPLE